MKQWHCHIGGQQYGPVDEATLRQWIAEGRVTRTDNIWAEGMAGWQPAGSVAEFIDAFSASAAASPATPPAVMAPQRPNAPGAVAAMVCGIIALVAPCAGLILGIIAIVMAISAKRALRDYPDYYNGASYATAGLILGIIAVGLSVVQIPLFFIFNALEHTNNSCAW